MGMPSGIITATTGFLFCSIYIEILYNAYVNFGKLRVAHLLWDYLPYSQTFIYEQIKQADRYQPYVFTLKTQNLERFALPSNQLISLESLSSGANALEIFKTKTLLKPHFFLQKIKELKIDIVHIHFLFSASWGLFLKENLNIPVVVSVYGLDAYLPNQNWFFKQKLKSIFKKIDFFTGYAPPLVQQLITLGCDSKKVIAHSSGISLENFSYQPRAWQPGQNFNLLMVARHVEKKGIRYAIEALAHLKTKYPFLKLHLVGDGILTSELKQLTKTLGLEAHVIFLGVMSDYSQYLYEAQLFLSPSVIAQNGDAEGGTNVAVLEACASGLPAIVTDQSQSDVIENNLTGFVVPQKDVLSLANQIEYFILHPNQISVFGKTASLRVKENFESKNQIKKIEALYDKLLKLS
jgi:colanic acid/amylovoran biosynthesis glycosyltransferase